MDIITDLQEADYHDIDALSSSRLKELLKSPGHYKQSLTRVFEDKAEFRVGTYTHALVLEPEKAAKYVVPPKLDKRTKVGKEKYKAWCDEQAEGYIEVNNDELGLARELAHSLILDETAAPLFSGDGKNELTIIGELRGHKVKARLDRVVGNVIIDVKTIASYRSNMGYYFLDYGYHIQASWYRLLYHLATNIPIEDIRFCFAFVEKKAPYQVRVYNMTDQALQHGDECILELLDLFDSCKEKDHWPLSVPVIDLELPIKMRS